MLVLTVHWWPTRCVGGLLVTFAKVKLHPSSSITRSVIHQAMTQSLIFVHEVGKLGGGKWLRALTNLYCGHSMMKKQIDNILETRRIQYRHWTWFSLANDPCRIYEWCCPLAQHWMIKENPTTPHWEVENLWFRNLDQHLPQLRFQILCSRFAIADVLKLLMLESNTWAIPQNWRCPH